MAVTIRQIAAAAGVSRGTVDRALNHRYGIKPEVAARIVRIADELGYRPNRAAKVLAGHQYARRIIAVLLVTGKNPFYTRILEGIRDALAEYADFGIDHRIDIMEQYDVARQLALLDELQRAPVSAVVMTPIQSARIAAKIDELEAAGIRVITINSDILGCARTAYVGCRHTRSGSVMAGVAGMIAAGREMKIGMMEGAAQNLALIRRKEGFLHTLSRDFPHLQVCATARNEDNDTLCAQATRAMLAAHPQLDLICVLGAGISGAIQALKEAGAVGKIRLLVYDLIDEVKMALHDDIVAATILQEPYRQGYEGIALAGKYLAFGEAPAHECYYTELRIVNKYCLEDVTD